MSIISPPDAPSASRNVGVTADRSQWSFGKLFARVLVILIGLALGCLIGAFVGLMNGWIEIQLC